MTLRAQSAGEQGPHSSNSSSARKSTRSEKQCDSPTKLNRSILSSAISSGMPTFLLTNGVPIVDRRAHRLVSAGTLARTHKKNLPPRGVDHPPGGALCLRGHTPTILSPSRIRVKPQRSVRGPRGSKDIKDGAFSKPGILGGLSVSPWVVQEEAERAQRAKSHRQALSKDPLVFRRKRDEGGLLDYAEETHAVKRFLDKIHPIRDESCPPKSGFSYRRVCHETEPPDFYDTILDSVRPRTTGFSPGHIRALSPTPSLTWGGRESSRASMEWGVGTGGSLGEVEATLVGGGRSVSARFRRSCPTPSHVENVNQSWATGGFSGEQPGAEGRPGSNQDAEADGASIEVRPMWSRQGWRATQDCLASSALRPFSSSCDHLGRSMSRNVLARSTACLKPQQFDTTQRRSEYTSALMAKREARLLREAEEVVSAKLGERRRKSAAEGREGIEKFEGSLKEILAQKWKYL